MARYKEGVTEGLQRIIDKALEKDPEMRFQHVEELLADLKRERRVYKNLVQSTVSLAPGRTVSTKEAGRLRLAVEFRC